MTTPLTSPFVREPASSAKNWRRIFNRANTSHRTKVMAEEQVLYVCGSAFEGNRFVTRSGIPLFKKPLEQRTTLTIYQDTNHSYVRLHKPGNDDLVCGKYALNKGLVKLSSQGQVIAYSLPDWLRRTVGIFMIGTCWLMSFIATFFPRKARLNDEIRLYRQVGQDYREHPNITFELTEQEYIKNQQYIKQLLKDPESTSPPLRFKTLGNNCSGFPRDTFLLTDYPGGFPDYFDEEAIRSRGFGFVASVMDAHGLSEALIRLLKTFACLLGILRHKHYLPLIILKDVKAQIPLARDAVTKARLSVKSKQKTHIPEWRNNLMRYFTSGQQFGYCEKLQRAKRYHEAVHELEVLLSLLEDKVSHKAYGVHATQASLFQDKSDLLLCRAIAEKIVFKLEA